MIDYKELMLKYMAHVGRVEGTDFTGISLKLSSYFTTDEKEELFDLSRESNKYD